MQVATCAETLAEGGAELRIVTARGATALHLCALNQGETCTKVVLGRAAVSGCIQSLVVARDVRRDRSFSCQLLPILGIFEKRVHLCTTKSLWTGERDDGS